MKRAILKLGGLLEIENKAPLIFESEKGGEVLSVPKEAVKSTTYLIKDRAMKNEVIL